MKPDTEKPRRGGARPGAGRKAKPKEERKTLYAIHLEPDLKRAVIAAKPDRVREILRAALGLPPGK